MRRWWIIGMCCWCAGVFAQTDSTWIHTYGGDRNDHGQDVIRTLDGGYCITGATSSFDLNNSQVYILKLDSVGDIQWSRTYGGPQIEWGNAIIQTQDSGYAVLGYTNSYGRGGYDLYLLKVDSLGRYEWDFAHGGTDWDFGYDLVEISDGRFVLVGETYSAGVGDRDGWFVVFDEQEESNPLLDVTFGGPGVDFFRSVVRAQDGSLFLAGGSEEGPHGALDILVTRYTPNADLVWAEYFGDTLDDYANDIVISENFPLGDNYMVTGLYTDPSNGEGRIELLVLESDGSIVLNDRWNFGTQAEGRVALRIEDNRYAAVGITNLNGPELDILFGKSFPGNLFFDVGTTMGSPQTDEAFGAVQNPSDSGYCIVGTTNGFNASYTDIILYKTNKNGIVTSSGYTFYNDDQVIQSVQRPDASEDRIRVYPNPFSDQVAISWEGLPASAVLECRVYDLSGRLLLQQSIGQGQVLPLSELSKGTYLLTLQDGETPVHTERLIKP